LGFDGQHFFLSYASLDLYEKRHGFFCGYRTQRESGDLVFGGALD
jgi:hypothetical protein